jgi:prepilin-type N-terminal cleavage/methylation domain-containing protein
MARTGHRSRGARGAPGFTLIETLIVVAVIAVLLFIAAPFTVHYRTRADARSHAERIMGILQSARDQAVSSGQPTWVLFDDPANPAGDPAKSFGDGVFAVVARDTDMESDFVIDTDGDLSQPFESAALAREVTGYGLSEGGTTPFGGAPLPGEDPASTALASLAELDAGTTFPVDPDTGLRGIGFTAQGIAISTAPPRSPGSGAGAYYVTDNNKAVYAVIVQPLGSVTIRTLNPENGEWR